MKIIALFISLAMMVACGVSMPQHNGQGYEGGPGSRPVLPKGCSPKEQTKHQFNCARNFYRNLQKNPRSTCKDHYDAYLYCIAKINMKCTPAGMGISFPGMLDMIVRRMKQQSYTKAMLKAVCDFSIMPPPLQGSGCNVSGRSEAAKCMHNFRTRYLKNRGDSGLCKAYTAALKCTISAVEIHCPGELKKGTKEEILDADQNLFCQAPKA